jgi:hypothetical protein
MLRAEICLLYGLNHGINFLQNLLTSCKFPSAKIYSTPRKTHPSTRFKDLFAVFNMFPATLRTVFGANGRMRVSAFFHGGIANERSRVSALAWKSVRTIVKS